VYFNSKGEIIYIKKEKEKIYNIEKPLTIQK